MRIALATDAWRPQVNGVVRALTTLVEGLEEAGHEVLTVSPDRFRTAPCPSEPGVRLALTTPWSVGRLLREFDPDAVHIATEGPVGLSARQHCVWTGTPFTTSYHTHFPKYLRMRMHIPEAVTWPAMRFFHRPASRVMVTNETLRRELAEHGLQRLEIWPRGVDSQLFRPREDVIVPGERPVMLFVGRVAAEKNLEAFLGLDLPGTKVVVGDGPQLPRLRRAHPGVHFAGVQHGETLSRYYAGADVFVFPSRTDTYGLVLLEALASGVPVAAYPVPGPRDVLEDAGSRVGCLHEDLAEAIRGALSLSRRECREFALQRSWHTTVDRFLELLRPLPRAQTA
ncbi:MAG TPA: glycosyltransferase family 1 protein [Gammaproteobacteria bacterium]|nr:glycosyltransferase family 1 protein [Gammaproteobacteria bacterium]